MHRLLFDRLILLFLFKICFDFLISKSDRKYSHTNSYDVAMTLIWQDDHLTAGT